MQTAKMLKQHLIPGCLIRYTFCLCSNIYLEIILFIYLLFLSFFILLTLVLEIVLIMCYIFYVIDIDIIIIFECKSSTCLE